MTAHRASLSRVASVSENAWACTRSSHGAWNDMLSLKSAWRLEHDSDQARSPKRRRREQETPRCRACVVESQPQASAPQAGPGFVASANGGKFRRANATKLDLAPRSSRPRAPPNGAANDTT